MGSVYSWVGCVLMGRGVSMNGVCLDGHSVQFVFLN